MSKGRRCGTLPRLGTPRGALPSPAGSLPGPRAARRRLPVAHSVFPGTLSCPTLLSFPCNKHSQEAHLHPGVHDAVQHRRGVGEVAPGLGGADAGLRAARSAGSGGGGGRVGGHDAAAAVCCSCIDGQLEPPSRVRPREAQAPGRDSRTSGRQQRHGNREGRSARRWLAEVPAGECARGARTTQHRWCDRREGGSPGGTLTSAHWSLYMGSEGCTDAGRTTSEGGRSRGSGGRSPGRGGGLGRGRGGGLGGALGEPRAIGGGGIGRLGAGGGGVAAARVTMRGGGTLAAPALAVARSCRPAACGSGSSCPRPPAMLTHTSGMAYSTPAGSGRQRRGPRAWR